MTRPSEAEVTEAEADANAKCAVLKAAHHVYDFERIERYASAVGRVVYLRERALSTPPLPSAEPPSVTVAKALMGDTWLAHRMDTPEKLRDHYVEYGRQSTPPAAAQDTVTDAEKDAFVQGAKWWEFRQTGATLWPSDRDEAYAIAEQKILAGQRAAARAAGGE